MRLFSALAAIGLLAASFAAHADTYATYRLDATFQDDVTAHGTLTLDTTPGAYDGLDVAFIADIQLVSPDQVAFVDSLTAFDQEKDHFTAFLLSPGSDLILLSVLGQLDGYAGGPICSEDFGTGLCQATTATFVSDGVIHPALDGSLTLLAIDGNAVTPEPSSFALLGTGLLGVAGVLKRRYA